MITVLLADDHALVRRGFKRLLEDDPDLRIVGEASSGDEAVQLAATLVPDVIVMDAAMPGMSGLLATKAIMAARKDAVVVMLSMHSEDTLVRQALANGARGYILKNAIDLDLAAVVKRVAAGEIVVDSALDKPGPLPGERAVRLTPREVEVLQLVCSGQSNRDISVTLGLSVNTVAVHRANIMRTLGVHKTAELVVYAIQNGLVTPS
jgi:DNA-binding NarL/FixJ family response regulator